MGLVDNIDHWVTIYTDAGWKDGRARCGFIARFDWGAGWASGTGRAKTDGPAAAEAVAALYGVRCTIDAVAKETSTPLEGVFLRTDCMQVVKDLQHGETRGGSADYRKALRSLRALLREHDIKLHVKHVPGHGKEQDRKRRWMNAQADRLGNMRSAG